jgi:hypothetical protein
MTMSILLALLGHGDRLIEPIFFPTGQANAICLQQRLRYRIPTRDKTAGLGEARSHLT